MTPPARDWPGGLWSLLDMQRLLAERLWLLASDWLDTRLNLHISENDEPIGDEDDIVRDLLRRTYTHCISLRLPTTRLLLEKKINELPVTSAELEMIETVLKSELKGRKFLSLSVDRADTYDREDLLSESANAAFPLAAQQLREAGNAHACELDTACVFHCMRALEHGISALAQDVGVTFGAQNWQNVLDQISSAILKLGQQPNTPQKAARLQFLSEACAEFRHFKDAWRNHVSHNKATYDGMQARRVLDHTTSFIETLSRELREAAP